MAPVLLLILMLGPIGFATCLDLRAAYRLLGQPAPSGLAVEA